MRWITKLVGGVLKMVQVGTDGAETGEVADLPQGVLTMEQVAGNFVPNKEVLRRARSLVKSDETLRNQLLDNEEFKTQALGKWGIDPNKAPEAGTGTGNVSGEQLSTLKKTWENAELNPLRERVTQLEKRNAGLVQNSLHSQIIAVSAELGIRDELLKAPGKGLNPTIVQMVKDNFVHDEESDNWYVRQGESFAISANPTAERAYSDVREFMEGFVKQSTFLVDTTRQKGPGAGNPGGPKEAKDAKSIAQEAEGKQDWSTAGAAKADQLSQLRPA